MDTNTVHSEVNCVKSSGQILEKRWYKNWMNWIHDAKLFDQLLHISGQICPYFQNQYVSGTNPGDFVGEFPTGGGDCWLTFATHFGMLLLMATRNPANSPVEVGSFSHYLQGVIHVGSCWVVQDFFHQQYQEFVERSLSR